MVDAFEPFDLRTRWIVKQTPLKDSWGRIAITIVNTMLDRDIYSYERNYRSFFDTFEPWRFWDGQQWRYFAFISASYTAYSVIDLMTGEVVAKHIPVGEGFCPVEFYVPDFYNILHEDDEDIEWNPNAEFFGGYDLVQFHRKRTLGFITGCLWGDDSTWKLRTLNLAECAVGIANAPVETFGYHVMPERLKLRDGINLDNAYLDGPLTLTIPSVMYYQMNEDGTNVSQYYYGTTDITGKRMN